MYWFSGRALSCGLAVHGKEEDEEMGLVSSPTATAATRNQSFTQPSLRYLCSCFHILVVLNF